MVVRQSLFALTLWIACGSVFTTSAARALDGTPQAVPASADAAGHSLEQMVANAADSDTEKLEQEMNESIRNNDLDGAVLRARQLYEKSVGGQDVNQLARHALDYSKLLIAQQDYSAAQIPLETALRLLQSNPAAEERSVIGTLIQLGELSSFLGDYQKAERILGQAVSLSQAYNGSESMKLKAVSLLRLAQTLDNGGADTAKTSPLYEQAFVILNNDATADPADLIDCLNYLAARLQADKKYADSMPLMQRALTLCSATFGDKHPDTAVVLNNLGMLYRDQEKYNEAAPLLHRALNILLETAGPDHLMVGRLYENIGELHYLKGEQAEAADCFLKAAAIANKRIFEDLPGQSHAEQEHYLASIVPREVSLLFGTCRQGKRLEQSYSMVLNWKGLLIESLRQHKLIGELAAGTASAGLVKKLEQLRSEIAGWYQMAGTVPYEDWKKNNDVLVSEKEHVERQLNDYTRRRLNLGFAALSLNDLVSALRDDEAFVDVFEYAPFGRQDDPHYALFVCCSNTSEPVRMVDIGPVREVSLAIAHWRNRVFAGQSAEEQWQEVKRLLWKPALSLLGTKAEKVVVCPDGELARLPWQLFADDTANGTMITEVDSARQFCELRKQNLHSPAQESLLIAGGIDFNANPYAASNIQPAVVKLPSLPGTLAEVKQIEALAAGKGIEINELSGAAATKASMIKMLPRSSYVHLATHGFFFDHNYVSAMRAIREEQVKLHRGVSVMPSFRKSASVRSRNPLVESGLALCGANLYCPDSRENLGYITAEEFVGLDLQGCRLMTLSACETGRGQEVTGQGVLGLRAAIMSCGVRTILMSLWKVSDDSTTRLMTEFYNNLWIKGQDKAEALRQAQASMQKSDNPSLRKPVNWAAWVLVGEGW